MSTPSPTESTAAIPDYDTDLDLTAEEKEAVEGALTAFAGYIETINRVFSSGGKDVANADQYVRDGSLKSLKKEAESMQREKQYMDGIYKAYNVQIESVTLGYDPKKSGEVSILFCVKDSEWGVVDVGETLPSSDPRSATMQHVANNIDGTWKIAHQYLWSEECR